MRTSIRLVISLALLALAACGGKADKKKSGGGDMWQGSGGLSAEWVQADLGPGGFAGLQMRVPNGAKVTKAMKISKADPDVAQIDNSMGFTVWFHAGKLDLAKAKAAIKKSSLRRFEKFVAEQPDAFIYTGKGLLGKSIFHFSVAVTVGGKPYTCRNATSVQFSDRKLADQMVASCRGVKAK